MFFNNFTKIPIDFSISGVCYYLSVTRIIGVLNADKITSENTELEDTAVPRQKIQLPLLGIVEDDNVLYFGFSTFSAPNSSFSNVFDAMIVGAYAALL